jgi:hypothetical protein
MSVRDTLLAAITAAVPEGTHVIPFQDNMDVPDRITVMFKQMSITPLAEAPRSGYVFNYILTVVSPAVDPSVAEEELDGFVPAMLGDLDGLDWFAWSTADKVLSQGQLAYDITCWNIAHKVPPAKAPPPIQLTAPRKTRTPSRKVKTNG